MEFVYANDDDSEKLLLRNSHYNTPHKHLKVSDEDKFF